MTKAHRLFQACLVASSCLLAACATPPESPSDLDASVLVDASSDTGTLASDSKSADGNGDTTLADTSACPIEGLLCDDGDPCTFGDRCAAGKCLAGADLCECRSKDDCATADDGNLCNGTMYCDVSKSPYRCRVLPSSIVTCKDPGAACAPIGCNPTNGACEPKPAPEGAQCNDGDPCTIGDVCKAGKCTAGMADVCECAKDSDCAAFASGDQCSGHLYCDASVFPARCKVNKATVVQCGADGGKPCMAPACDPADGKCKPVPVNNGTACDSPATECKSPDFCHGGKCIAASTCLCSSDADCAKAGSGDLCDGTMFCNVAAGACQLNPATKVVCPSNLDGPCRANTCVPLSGACTLVLAPDAQPCDDGKANTIKDACAAGKCVGVQADVCTADGDCAQLDINKCAGKHFCDKSVAGGVCKLDTSKATVCSGTLDTSCRKNQCVPTTGACKMTDVDDGTACDDGEPCFVNDVCVSGVCQAGKTKKCKCVSDADCVDEDGDLCTGVPYCDKSDTGGHTCKHNPATKVVCKHSGDVCQPNVCDPKTGSCGLANAATATGCDDGKLCTKDDHCAAGLCVGDPVVCPQTDLCTNVACVASKGCVATPKACGDGNACTVDSCLKSTGKCVQANADSGVLCDIDNSGCTVNDFCADGACKPGAAVSCKLSGLGACETAKCVGTGPASYKCVATTRDDGLDCDDGAACTAGASCKSGECVAGQIDKLWTRVLAPQAVHTAAQLNAVVALGEHDAVVAGHFSAAGGKGGWWLARVGELGAAQWHLLTPAATPPSDATGTDIAANAALVTEIGDVIAVGAQVAQQADLRATVVRFSGKGAQLDQSWFGSSNSAESFLAAARAPNGDLALGGWQRFKAKRSVWVVLVDAGGAPKWQKTDPDYADSEARAIALLADGTIAVGGVAQTTKGASPVAYLSRLAAGGQRLWRTLLRGSGGQAVNTLRSATGPLMAAGWRDVAGARKPLVLAVELDGGLLWSRVNGASGELTAWLPGPATDTVAVGQAVSQGGGTGRISAVDRLGNQHWLNEHGEDAEFSGITRQSGSRLVAAGSVRIGGKQQGFLVRADGFGRASCAQSGGCHDRSDGCVDGKPCTLDRCDAKTGCSNPQAAGIACPYDDGCVRSGSCAAGSCTPGASARVFVSDMTTVGPHRLINLSAFDDGSFVVSGRADADNVFIARADRDGKPTSQLKVKLDKIDQHDDVLALPGGDALVFGGYWVNKGIDARRTVLRRVSPAGATVWHREFGHKFIDTCPAVLSNDGTHAVTFQMENNYRFYPRPRRFRLTDGDMQFGQVFKEVLYHQHHYPRAAIALPDGGYLLATNFEQEGFPKYSAFGLYRFYPDLNRAWYGRGALQPKHRLVVRDLVDRGDGDYALVGQDNFATGNRWRWQVLFARCPASGGCALLHPASPPAVSKYHRWPTAGRGNADKTFDIFGETETKSGRNAIFMDRIDPTGKVLASRTWASGAFSIGIRPYGRQLLTDGRFGLLGGVESLGSWRPYLVVVDRWGNSPCAQSGSCVLTTPQECGEGCTIYGCEAGKKCSKLAARDCDDKDATTLDSCDPKAGKCVHEIKPVTLPGAGDGWRQVVGDKPEVPAGATLQYLYWNGSKWYKSPKTKQKWSWGNGYELTGTWSWFNGKDTGTFFCKGSTEKPAFLIGCSEGGGSTHKVIAQAVHAQRWVRVCQDKPGIFGGNACHNNLHMCIRWD